MTSRFFPLQLGLWLMAATNLPAAIATDNAGNSVYNDGWQSGDNGGSGFGAWSLSSSGTAGFFMGNSANNGDGGGNINTAGRAWGLYANSGGVAGAIRPFNSALAVGETLTLKMDNGWVRSGGTVGFTLRSGGTTRFEFYFRGGQSFYEINDSRGANQPTTFGFTDDGFGISFQLTGANSYTFQINSGTYSFSGSLLNSGGIDSIRFFSAFNDAGGAYDLFFNDLQVVPEPTTWALGGFAALGGLTLLGRRLRKSGSADASSPTP